MGSPFLVVDVVCSQVRQTLGGAVSFGSVYAVVDGTYEPIDTVETMKIDYYGDQHEWVNTSAQLYERDGTHYVDFDGLWQRIDGRWRSIATRDVLSSARPVGPPLPVRADDLTPYRALPNTLEFLPDGMLRARTDSKKFVELGRVDELLAGTQPRSRRAELYIVNEGVVVSLEPGPRETEPLLHLLPVGAQRFERVVDPARYAELTRAMRRRETTDHIELGFGPR